MKTKIYVIMTGVVLLGAWSAQAVLTDKTFTSSGQILPGEEWGNVYIYNDDTIVDMLGGSADSMGTYDASTLNVLDGYVSTMEVMEYSRANVSGGNLGGVHALGNATVNFSGDATAVLLSAGSEYGIVNMTAGTVDYLGAGDWGIINLYGGTISENVGATGSSTVNIYGYDFDYDPTAGAYDGGQLTGFWLNGSPFTLDLYGGETYSHINLIPEPSSLILLGAGVLFAKRAC
ncbi:MAG: PEP-CTERM sorting domain-containing protein [Planctomycetota bacterium]|jgi:hypothetical protein